jgi:hypothetical protein
VGECPNSIASFTPGLAASKALVISLAASVNDDGAKIFKDTFLGGSVGAKVGLATGVGLLHPHKTRMKLRAKVTSASFFMANLF